MNFREYSPRLCWVNDHQKICYNSEDEALLAASVAAYDHGAKNLTAYKCPYGPHWHLAHKKPQKP